MIQNTQTNKHQLGALTGASKCENYYELHFTTGEIAHFYILANGFFRLKGHRIVIKHDQITGKGGVIMPVSFFWSNAGYGELRNTNQPGIYDFGKSTPGTTILTHQDKIFDCFYLLGSNPQEILQHYYTLTGKPVMLPEYAFGLGHIGDFCTTLWQPSKAQERNACKIGNNYYIRTKDQDAASGKASLNGEENYQFSARAMIDQYHAQHFP